MSHANTQQTPQWAIDAARECYGTHLGDSPYPQKVIDRLAAIIARHAPKAEPLHVRMINSRDARIVELEAALRLVVASGPIANADPGTHQIARDALGK